MAYSIIRASKIKTFQEAGAIYSHNTRKEFDKEGHLIERDNVDYNKTEYNTYWHFIGENVGDGIKKRLEDLNITPRKNAVLGIEYVVSASPEFFDETKNNYSTDSYFIEALNFIERKHGRDNVVSFNIHLDEQTPHAHIVVVPIDKKNKLNCRDFLGGKEKLSELQEEFNKAMQHTSRGVELKRGEKKNHGEPEKYIKQTSHILGHLRKDYTNLVSTIDICQKNATEALKSLNLDLAKIEMMKLEQAQKKIEALKIESEKAKASFHKQPKRDNGMEM
jgi:hypothetical protein